MTKEDNSKAAEKKEGDKAGDAKDDKKPTKESNPLTESDIAMFKRYGKGPYTDRLKKAEDDMKEFNQKITVLIGIKESDTGLALPA
jgi:26S proteasome regulatory subunit T1